VLKAAKRSGYAAKQGAISCYIHDGRIGTMVELNCETDFVAKTDEFKQLLNHLCLHIAATEQVYYLNEEEIPESVIEREKEIARESMADSGKQPEILEKIIEGKIAKWKKTVCLLSQPFYEEDKKTVQDVITEMGAKSGENISCARFAKFVLGE
ncbi:elongation factor Ts, partial [Candidatus Riflebacteria bacterium]